MYFDVNPRTLAAAIKRSEREIERAPDGRGRPRALTDEDVRRALYPSTRVLRMGGWRIRTGKEGRTQCDMNTTEGSGYIFHKRQ